ncbi:MAG TPA: bifunctional aldolase/short-chain dehydrogenase [Streptosporangiaceae bacterium]|jgi:rhamnose utilization protein RhaD (predicted bifunctional aldolase and dehydrogenase)/NAD(P)-dependent dehydrogenase (short-subunit alcohol dehydrogenase family)
MENRWDDAEAARHPGDLGQRVYSSRLIGADPALVLYGGGNTSVKISETGLLGPAGDVLYVKGSGFGLDGITEAGFAPVRASHLIALSELDQLSDLEMARQLRLATLEPAAPAPSVEAILHAVLPFRYADHAHADAVIALTNTPSGPAHVRAAYGDQVLLVPYVMPGFELSRLVARMVAGQLSPRTRGLILAGHGLFSFGGTARESYGALIDLVTIAEDYLKAHGAWDLPDPGAGHQGTDGPAGIELARLRAGLSGLAGFPLLLQRQDDPLAAQFARRDDVAGLSQQGPATPDHVIRTKRVPLLGQDADGYARGYQEYFSQQAARHPDGASLRMLDPAPRVILDPGLGLCTAGRRPADVVAAARIYHHTIEVILRASALERWTALPPADIFAVEYWDLEQAKLRRQGDPPEFTGEVAVVTGAASGIGRACAQALAARGAAVCGLDISPAVEQVLPGPGYLGVSCDLRSEQQAQAALERAAARFGGVDMLVLCAGTFPPSARIEALDSAAWSQAFAVNADAALALLRLAFPFLCLAPGGGRVVVIASKNVPAPGPGAAAYSASKAALTQLARVAALEWAPHRIRVNILHPDAVFDTGMWTPEMIEERAAQYGLTPAQYRRRNLLGAEVTSGDVAGLVTAMCGPLFAKVTGAQLAVDGGNERVI